MEPILTIDNLNSFGGNMLRQGDKSQLKYRLRDVGNKNLSISSKPCQVKMYGRNYTTVVYETSTTVSSDNTVTFTIDKVLPKGTFYLEFTVGDYIFPTDHREFFEITPSGKGMEANIIEIVGKDVLIQAVKSQVDTELQPLVTSLESAQQAEAQRVSAESNRVSAEEQRKTDHANRSAELAGKADKVVLKNEIENGDFSKGLTGFTPISPARDKLEKTEKGLKVTSLVDANDLGFFMPKLNLTKGNSYYGYITHDSNNTRLQTADNMRFQSLSNSVQAVPLSYSDTLSSAKFNAISDFSYSYFSAGVRGSNPNQIKPGDTFTINHLGVIDLTETFGAGNEPTQEEMDELIKVTGYIDGEYALNNKEMLGHLMKGIREKANKKQEDWITPTLLNGWVEVPGYSVGYYKDEFGIVRLRGRIMSGVMPSSMFMLPVGYRPKQSYTVPMLTGSKIDYISVSSYGVVTTSSSSNNSLVVLDSVQFKAEG